MEQWLPLLLAAVRDVGALVRWPLWGFSTEVHPITRAELAAGRFKSTGGTHIGCVASHLLQHGVRRAVLVTDGMVQTLPAAQRARLERAKPLVHVGLLEGGDASSCEGLRWKVTRLPPLDRGDD
jgi:hypothetical protein